MTAVSKIFIYQGLTTCTEVDKRWTIMSSVYNHLRQGGGGSTSELRTLMRAEVQQQERLEAAVLCAIKKWVGQGKKATLATAPDAHILREIVCLLTQRVRAGRATFLIKVKSHRGEPINERADTLRRRDEQFRTTTKVGMIGLIG